MCKLLPSRYVAAKFYGRDSFPADESNRQLVRQFLLKMSEQMPVVIMDHQFKVDDHESFANSDIPNVIRIGDKMNLADNLAAQSAVVAGADMVFSTYGGFTYLPVLLGRPAIGLVSHENHMLSAHANVVFAMADAVGGNVSILNVESFRRLVEL